MTGFEPGLRLSFPTQFKLLSFGETLIGKA